MDANLLRNWLRTIERIVLPFEARSLTPADTNSESRLASIGRRQLVTRGAPHLGRGLTRIGTGMIAYGSQPTQTGYSSHVMWRDTTGNRQFKPHSHRGIDYTKPADSKWTPLGRKENFAQNHERSHTAWRKGGTSTKTVPRSRIMVGTGSVFVIAGRLVPVLAVGYVAYDILSSDNIEDTQTYDSLERQHDLSSDTITTGLQFGKSIYSSPLGKAVISVGFSKLSLDVFS
jgi:general stress protein YciG